MRLLLASVEAYLDEYNLDKGRQVRDGIKEFHALLDARQPGGAALGVPSVL